LFSQNGYAWIIVELLLHCVGCYKVIGINVDFRS
jgi:hypothetical protein